MPLLTEGFDLKRYYANNKGQGRAGFIKSFPYYTYLQSVAHPEIFGGGDCIRFEKQPLDKVGVYAVRQNPILYHNLMAALERGNLQAFRPQNRYLLIYNLGNGTGIFYRGRWVLKGRLIFYLKDYIDRKFMRNFQVSGETAELTV